MLDYGNMLHERIFARKRFRRTPDFDTDLFESVMSRQNTDATVSSTIPRGSVQQLHVIEHSETTSRNRLDETRTPL